MVVLACIPDLPSLSAPDGEGGAPDVATETTPPPGGPRCGDGIIQLDAGEQCDPNKVLAADATSGACTADCKVVCGGAVWPENNHCYALQAKGATALLDTAAVDECTAVGGHVVTFASDEELAFVLTNLKVVRPFWVGLDPAQLGFPDEYTSFVTYEPGWSSTCSGCYLHGPDASPLSGDAGSGCVEAVEDGGFWEQYPCNQDDGGKLDVVCEREPVGVLSQRCDGGLCIELVWTQGRKRYLYVSKQATFDDAEQNCGDLGGSLVVLETRDEREQLWHEIDRSGSVPPASPTFAFWIGLSRQAGTWTWDDGQPVGVYASPWGDGQPDGTSSHAYLTWTSANPLPVDQTLAKDDLGDQATLPYVCQFLLPDGGI
jgi:hypothetical protein